MNTPSINGLRGAADTSNTKNDDSSIERKSIKRTTRQREEDPEDDTIMQPCKPAHLLSDGGAPDIKVARNNNHRHGSPGLEAREAPTNSTKRNSATAAKSIEPTATNGKRQRNDVKIYPPPCLTEEVNSDKQTSRAKKAEEKDGELEDNKDHNGGGDSEHGDLGDDVDDDDDIEGDVPWKLPSEDIGAQMERRLREDIENARIKSEAAYPSSLSIINSNVPADDMEGDVPWTLPSEDIDSRRVRLQQEDMQNELIKSVGVCNNHSQMDSTCKGVLEEQKSLKSACLKHLTPAMSRSPQTSRTKEGVPISELKEHDASISPYYVGAVAVTPRLDVAEGGEEAERSVADAASSSSNPAQTTGGDNSVNDDTNNIQSDREIRVSSTDLTSTMSNEEREDGEIESGSVHKSDTLLYDIENIQATLIDETSFVQAESVQNFTKSRRRIIMLTGILIIIIVGLAAGFGVAFGLRGDEDSEGEGVDPATPILQPLKPTLETITEEGSLRCGVGYFVNENEDTGELEGFEVDLCRAIAAAAGIPTKPIFVTYAERWEALKNGTVDVVTLASTIFIERDVFQEDAKVGFTLTIPYMYEGVAYGGTPEFVTCADSLTATIGTFCEDLRICVDEGSSVVQFIDDFFPSRNVVPVQSGMLQQSFSDGKCNVIADGSFAVTEKAVRSVGYDGPYQLGVNLFNREPYTIVTRDNDNQWSDFVNWVLIALLAAEQQNITKDTTQDFKTTTVFGNQFKNMFVDAISAVGNYGEMYSRNLGELPRTGPNLINSGTGLIYSHPFGSPMKKGPGPHAESTLERIVERGYLLCGITRRDGFGQLDQDDGIWVGMDADYCRALEGSIFHDESSKVEYVELPDSGDRYVALANGKVDVLTGASLNLTTDVMEPTTKTGFTFCQPYFYRGDEAIALATRHGDAQWSDFVHWVVTSTFYAEEQSFTQDDHGQMPIVNLFGPHFKNMLGNAISAVGNYGAMYSRNLNSSIPREGRNLLNVNPYGPQQYIVPGLA